MKYSLVKATIRDVKEYRTQYINECLIVFNDININELELADIVYYYILNREYKKRTNN
jgi:hypothetical protein